jgi:hypothetical protein
MSTHAHGSRRRIIILGLALGVVAAIATATSTAEASSSRVYPLATVKRLTLSAMRIGCREARQQRREAGLVMTGAVYDKQARRVPHTNPSSLDFRHEPAEGFWEAYCGFSVYLLGKAQRNYAGAIWMGNCVFQIMGVYEDDHRSCRSLGLRP